MGSEDYKTELQSFEIDTNFIMDNKIQLLESLHGIQALGIWLKLLAKIYGDKGYYCGWTDNDRIIFAKAASINVGELDKIVEYMLDLGIFNKDKFTKRTILTSKRVQNHYLEKTSRRKMVELIKENICSGVSEMIKRENVAIYSDEKGKYIKQVGDYQKKKYAKYVLLTETEHKKLIKEHGEDFVKRCITRLDNYKGAKRGRTYKSDYRAILNWVVRAVKEDIYKERNHGGRQKKYTPRKYSAEEIEQIEKRKKDV